LKDVGRLVRSGGKIRLAAKDHVFAVGKRRRVQLEGCDVGAIAWAHVRPHPGQTMPSECLLQRLLMGHRHPRAANPQRMKG
jgi:hypothetical protein